MVGENELASHPTHTHTHTREAHLGKCWANETVSTSRVSVCAATYSATSWSAVDSGSARSRGRRQHHILDSLGNVVTYGAPPLASRIWSRVSLKSLPLAPLEEADVVAGVAAATAVEEEEEASGASTIGRPSRSAFSRAVFSARAFLSASICARTAALALASSILSVQVVNR